MGWLRLFLIPLGFLAFSIYGVISAFGIQLNTTALWILGVFAGIAMGMAVGVKTQRSDNANDVIVKGSWIPMLLIMGIFITKYSVGVAIALKAAALQTTQSAYLISFMYGVFSGVFTGRAILVFRLMKQSPITK
jgi:hypothetical protein